MKDCKYVLPTSSESINPYLIFSNLGVWALTFGMLSFNIKSIGYISWITVYLPVVLILSLMIWSLTLEGSVSIGLSLMFTPST